MKEGIFFLFTAALYSCCFIDDNKQSTITTLELAKSACLQMFKISLIYYCYYLRLQGENVRLEILLVCVCDMKTDTLKLKASQVFFAATRGECTVLAKSLLKCTHPTSRSRLIRLFSCVAF